MKTVYELLSSSWAQALGWTLIHSVWQSFAIFLVVFCALRITATKFSNTRYMISLGGLLLICLSGVVTFFYIFQSLNNQIAPSGNFNYAPHLAALTPLQETGNNLGLVYFLQANMPFVLCAWSLGTIIFLLRTVGGWWYVSTLKKESTPITNQWIETLNTLGYKLGIKRWIELASSSKISAPMVFGYLKPIVLVPAGLFTGLTPAQIETVFLHELTHIKRNDYIVNLIQLFLESIFFFNPFVWIISSTVRQEREHCCDDAVLMHHANSKDYAYALTKLEEVRLQNVRLALSLSGNNYHLLARIKRIMEKSVQNYSVRDRIVPVALLIAGLACASWLTIQPEKESNATSHKIQKPDITFASLSDTTKKDKRGRYSRKEIITMDENGKTNKEIAEEFNGDEDLKPVIAPGNIDLMVDYNLPLPADSEPFALAMPSMGFGLRIDSLPPVSNEWQKQFNEEFEKAFKENFSEFYGMHEAEIHKMMHQLQEKFQHGSAFNFFDNEQFQMQIEEQMGQAEKRLQESFAQLEQMKDINIDNQMRLLEENLKMMEHRIEFDEQANHEFESVLQQELLKDGYLKKGEELNIEWNLEKGGESSMKVNGKKIKKEDQRKYKALQDEYQQKRIRPITE